MRASEDAIATYRPVRVSSPHVSAGVDGLSVYDDTRPGPRAEAGTGAGARMAGAGAGAGGGAGAGVLGRGREQYLREKTERSAAEEAECTFRPKFTRPPAYIARRVAGPGHDLHMAYPYTFASSIPCGDCYSFTMTPFSYLLLLKVYPYTFTTFASSVS